MLQNCSVLLQDHGGTVKYVGIDVGYLILDVDMDVDESLIISQKIMHWFAWIT